MVQPPELIIIYSEKKLLLPFLCQKKLNIAKVCFYVPTRTLELIFCMTTQNSNRDMAYL